MRMLVLALVAAGCGGPPPMVLHRHASSAEITVPEGWRVALDGSRAYAASADRKWHLVVFAYPAGTNVAVLSEGPTTAGWACGQGVLTDGGPWTSECARDDGTEVIHVALSGPKPGLDLARRIAERIRNIHHRQTTVSMPAFPTCRESLEWMKARVRGATLLEDVRAPLLKVLDVDDATCPRMVEAYQRTVEELTGP